MNFSRRWRSAAAAMTLLVILAAPAAASWEDPDAPGSPGHGWDESGSGPPIDSVGDPDTGGGQIVFDRSDEVLLLLRHSPSAWQRAAERVIRVVLRQSRMGIRFVKSGAPYGR